MQGNEVQNSENTLGRNLKRVLPWFLALLGLSVVVGNEAGKSDIWDAKPASKDVLAKPKSAEYTPKPEPKQATHRPGELQYSKSLPKELEPFFGSKTLEEAVESQREWTLNYIQSPMYRTILTKQITMQEQNFRGTVDQEAIDATVGRLIVERHSRVKNAFVGYEDILLYEGKPSHGVTIVEDSTDHTNISISISLAPKEPSVGVHEFEHAGAVYSPDIKYSYFDQYYFVGVYLSGLAMGHTTKYMHEYLAKGHRGIKGAEKYEFRPWEVSAFVTELKYYADLFDVMDPMTQKFTLDHYTVLKNTMMKFLPSDSFLCLYFRDLKPENIIELFNSVADTDESIIYGKRDS